MSRDLNTILKAATRTAELISLAEQAVENEAVRSHILTVQDDLEKTVASINRRTNLTRSDELIFTEFLSGVIQSALSLLCSGGSVGCTINL